MLDIYLGRNPVFTPLFPMHHVFAIPELVEECIAKVQDKKSLCAIARTCHALKGPALRALWSELDSVVPLLLLLGLHRPLLATSNLKEWCFIHRPGPDEYAIFHKYSCLVRRLTFNQAPTFQGVPIKLVHTVHWVVALSMPPGKPLLPNLQSLSISTTTAQHQLEALPWLSPSLLEIQMDMATVDSRNSGLFLQELPIRCPGLKRLEITSRLAYFMLGDSTVKCVSGLKCLEEIILPWGFLQVPTAKALATLPNLRKIRMRGDAVDPPPTFLSPNLLSQVKFPCLEHLSVYTSLHSAAAVLAKGTCATTLEIIEVTSRFDITLEGLPKFFEAISSSRYTMRNLSAIRLDLRGQVNGNSLAKALTFNHILPLLDHCGIARFFVRHNHPFHATFDQLRQILQAWPNLVELILCVDPQPSLLGGSDSGPALPLAALQVFAKFSPNLEELGLYFNTASKIKLSVLPQSFEKLKRLYVGTSLAPRDIFGAALLLGELCNRNMTIEYGEQRIPPYTRTPGANAGVNATDDTRAIWKEVEAKFKEIARVRDRAMARKAMVRLTQLAESQLASKLALVL